MAAVANPEPEHPFRQTDMELREQQRKQAIAVKKPCYNQELSKRRCRMEYYVIQISFCREFQTSFFQAHDQSPDTLSISF